MTSPNIFNDMMPHTIVVAGSATTASRSGNYGGVTPGTSRTYRCLLDQGETITRETGATEFRAGLVAYVNPIPVNQTTPVNILDTDVVFVNGVKTPVDAVERHWDENGTLFSLVVRFE